MAEETNAYRTFMWRPLDQCPCRQRYKRRTTLRKILQRWVVRTKDGSESHSMAGFDIGSVDPMGSVATVR
jgi:hypothetical protein